MTLSCAQLSNFVWYSNCQGKKHLKKLKAWIHYQHVEKHLSINAVSDLGRVDPQCKMKKDRSADIDRHCWKCSVSEGSVKAA